MDIAIVKQIPKIATMMEVIAAFWKLASLKKLSDVMMKIAKTQQKLKPALERLVIVSIQKSVSWFDFEKPFWSTLSQINSKFILKKMFPIF